jgi:hypothetical protein
MDEDLVLCLFLLLPIVSGGLLVLVARASRIAGWPRLLLGNLTVLLLLLSIALLAGEVYYRFFYDSTDALGYTKVSKRWYQRHWQANSSDCRDSLNYSLKPKPDRRRISFLGDSFTAGHGIPKVEDRFANRVRRAHPEWEIHVLAQPGFDTGNELQYLQNIVNQGYGLDEVVLVYCLNDVADMFPEWAETVERVRAADERRSWLLSSSYCLNTLYYRLRVRPAPDARSYFDYIKQGYRGAQWDRQKQRLKAIRDLVESHAGRLAVVTFPLMHALGPRYEYQSAHDELNQFWRELNVPHLDLLAIYRDLPPGKVTVNRFDGHPNEYANALAAEAIEKFLGEQMALKAAPQ